jgi:hypothetical protein
MTITKSSLRLVLLLQLCLTFLDMWAHSMTLKSLPPEVQAFLRQQHPYPLSLHDVLFLLFGGIYLLLCLVCFIGLFFFFPFSRKFFVTLILAGLLLDPFLNLQIKSGWEILFADCLWVLNAVIIVMTYFSPLKDHFERKMEVGIIS